MLRAAVKQNSATLRQVLLFGSFRRAWSVWLLACAALLGTAPARADAGPSDGANLLAGKRPFRSSGARGVDRLTDGMQAVEGDFWRTELTTVLRSSKAFVDYDLGQETAVEAAYLQGDNDDRYIVSTSLDGETFTPLWEAPNVGRAGLRPRMAVDLHGRARYVRLSAARGDGKYAVSEFQVFSSRPSSWPPDLPAMAGTPSHLALHSKVIAFGVAVALFLVFVHRRASRWAPLLIVAPLACGAYAVLGIAELWPLPLFEMSLLRATLAGIAIFAIAREAWASEKNRIDPRWTVGVLAFAAAGSVACYYNLFSPQFHDHKNDRPTVVHPFDMRVYFPVAKYFHELKFDGLYLASVAAYLDDDPRVTTATLARQDIRDLRDHRIRHIGEIADQIEGVKTRFTPERWEEFREDMRYFRETMGVKDYLWSLTDHGGNATPVWIFVARLLFAHAKASDATLIATGLLDPLLLAILFVVVARTFGIRTMLVSIVVFGATDFYMFGSNWAGATLRDDWMVAVGLGACALKKERWALGGALLAYGALIRAFPALATAFLVVPALLYAVETYREKKRLPSREELRELAKPLGLALLGAAATVAVLFLVTTAAFSLSTWSLWLAKVKTLSKDAHLNHVGLRTLIMFDPDNRVGAGGSWQDIQNATYLARRPLYGAGVALFGGLAVLSCRKKRLEQAALFGLFLIPILFYPANYYCHYIFLLPMVMANGKKEFEKDFFTWTSMAILGICFAQYYTLERGNTDLCFLQQSIILLVAFLAVLGSVAYENYGAGFAVLSRRLATYLESAPASPAAGAKAPASPTSPGAAPSATTPDEATGAGDEDRTGESSRKVSQA
jgi:hypothetical protein